MKCKFEIFILGKFEKVKILMIECLFKNTKKQHFFLWEFPAKPINDIPENQVKSHSKKSHTKHWKKSKQKSLKLMKITSLKS